MSRLLAFEADDLTLLYLSFLVFFWDKSFLFLPSDQPLEIFLARWAISSFFSSLSLSEDSSSSSSVSFQTFMALEEVDLLWIDFKAKDLPFLLVSSDALFNSILWVFRDLMRASRLSTFKSFASWIAVTLGRQALDKLLRIFLTISTLDYLFPNAFNWGVFWECLDPQWLECVCYLCKEMICI